MTTILILGLIGIQQTQLVLSEPTQKSVERSLGIFWELTTIGDSKFKHQYRFEPQKAKNWCRLDGLSFEDAHGQYRVKSDAPGYPSGFPDINFFKDGRLAVVTGYIPRDNSLTHVMEHADLRRSALRAAELLSSQLTGFDVAVNEGRRLGPDTTEWLFSASLSYKGVQVGDSEWARIRVTDFSGQINGLSVVGYPGEIETPGSRKSQDELQIRAAATILGLREVDQVSVTKDMGLRFSGASTLGGRFFKTTPRTTELQKTGKSVLTQKFQFGDDGFPMRYEVTMDCRTGEPLQVSTLIPMSGSIPSAKGLAKLSGSSFSASLNDAASGRGRMVTLRVRSDLKISGVAREVVIRIGKDYFSGRQYADRVVVIGNQRFKF